MISHVLRLGVKIFHIQILKIFRDICIDFFKFKNFNSVFFICLGKFKCFNLNALLDSVLHYYHHNTKKTFLPFKNCNVKITFQHLCFHLNATFIPKIFATQIFSITIQQSWLRITEVSKLLLHDRFFQYAKRLR